MAARGMARAAMYKLRRKVTGNTSVGEVGLGEGVTGEFNAGRKSECGDSIITY